MKYEIWGPSTGSTFITVEKSFYNRVEIDIETDFGHVKGVLDRKGATELRDALNEVLNDS